MYIIIIDGWQCTSDRVGGVPLDGQFSLADEYVARRLRYQKLVRLSERTWGDRRPPLMFISGTSVSWISAIILTMSIGLLCYELIHGL